MAQIAPSVLGADFCRLGDDVLDAVACGVDMLHLDIMDGHFVPNISYGPGGPPEICSGTLCPQPRDRSTGGKPSLGKVIGHIGGRLYDNRLSAQRTSQTLGDQIVVRGKATGTPAGEVLRCQTDRQEL